MKRALMPRKEFSSRVLLLTIFWLLPVACAVTLSQDGECPVIRMFPFSIGHGRWNAKANQKLSFSFLAASELAIQHFNDRNPVVVPELGLLENCSVHFPPAPVLDSAMVGGTAVKAFWTATQNTSLPCAVLGPMDSRATEDMVAVTSALEIPQLIYYAELDRFATARNGNAVGTVLTPNARAHRIVEFLHSRRYLAVVHFGKDGSSDLAEELLDVGQEEYGMVVRTFQRALGVGGTAAVVDSLFDSNITTILLNFDNPSSLGGFSKALNEKGMLGAEYVYILSPDGVPTDRIGENYDGEDAGSAMDKLLSGALIFDQIDPFRIHHKEDPFLLAWKDQNSDVVKHLNALHPLPTSEEAYFQAEPDFFRNEMPSNHASYVYDAIISLGFGACAALQERSQKNDSLLVDEVVDGILAASFRGASGAISFSEGAKYRSSRDIKVGLFNIRGETTSQGGRSYRAVLASLWVRELGWQNLNGTDIVYSNGQVVPPPSLRELEHNYLSDKVRYVGLSIFGFTWLVILSAAGLIVFLRNDPYIQRSQPFFLLMLCAGSLVTSTAIATLSWDEGAGATNRQLDIACMSTQWFFFVGQITSFMALFSKLWRIDQILQFRRRAVTVKQVVGPLVVLLACAILILVLWTAIDPWRWERDVISILPAESHGQCTSDNFWAFAAPLIALLLTAKVVAAVLAWKTSDVPEEFGDSRTVIISMFAQFQTWVVGIPLLVVLDDSHTDATYFGRVLLIWIFAISSVLVVVSPKLYWAVRLRNRSNLRARDRVRVSGFVSAPLSAGSPSSASSGRMPVEEAPRKSSASCVTR